METYFTEELRREGLIDDEDKTTCAIRICFNLATGTFDGDELCDAHMAQYNTVVKIRPLGFERFNIMQSVLAGALISAPSKRLKYG